LPRSRAARRRPAISFGGTRTTRSPRAMRKRSSRPETWRQSSIAQTRSRSSERPQASIRSSPAPVACTVSLPCSSPVAAPTAAQVWLRLCGSDPITIICGVPSFDMSTTKRISGRHTSVGAMPRSYQVRPAILGRRRATQPMSVRPLGRQGPNESARRRPGPHRSNRTSPPGRPDVDTEGPISAESAVIPGNRIQPKSAETSVYAEIADDCHAEGRGFESHQPLRLDPLPERVFAFLRALPATPRHRQIALLAHCWPNGRVRRARRERLRGSHRVVGSVAPRVGCVNPVGAVLVEDPRAPAQKSDASIECCAFRTTREATRAHFTALRQSAATVTTGRACLPLRGVRGARDRRDPPRTRDPAAPGRAACTSEGRSGVPRRCQPARSAPALELVLRHARHAPALASPARRATLDLSAKTARATSDRR
jgi:hypothetical protein